LYLSLNQFVAIFSNPKINIVLGHLANPIEMENDREQFHFLLDDYIDSPKRRSVFLVSTNKV
jgi:hypothetical protein